MDSWVLLQLVIAVSIASLWSCKPTTTKTLKLHYVLAYTQILLNIFCLFWLKVSEQKQ